MTSLFVRQPGRLASRLASLDTPSGSPWICHSCRIHAAAGKAANSYIQDQNGRCRRKRPSQESLRHITSSTAKTTGEDLPKSPTSSQAKVEFLRDIFETGTANAIQSGPQTQNDVYGLIQALRDGDVDKLKFALEHASEDHEYIVSIPKSSWTEIIRQLRPENILLPLHRIHRSFNDRKLQLSGFDPMVKRRAYMETLVAVIRIRRQYGIHLDVVDYRLLLQYAGKTGNELAAKKLWVDMSKDNVQPDVLCYNAYMEAIVWDEQSRLRQRKRAKQPWNWRGKPKPTDILLFKPGASVVVAELFNDMVARRVSGNTATFCVLMKALARDGELQGAEGIISNVWGIDVKNLMEGNQPAQPKNTLRADSPTYPDQRLLVTIADIFGSANQVHVALRLINYLSKYYGIKIAENVWYQISQWTWLQSRIKEKERRQASEFPMRLSMVPKLFDTMAAAPHHIDPSMDHLDVLFKSAGVSDGEGRDQPRIAKLLRIFEKGLERHMRYRMRHHEASNQLRKAQDRPPIWTVPRKSTDRLQQATELAYMKRWLSYEILQRWCRKLIDLDGLKFKDDAGRWNDEISAWRLRGLPRFLAEHGRFAPSIVKYDLEAGYIQLLFRTQEEVDDHKLRKAASMSRFFESGQGRGHRRTSDSSSQ